MTPILLSILLIVIPAVWGLAHLLLPGKLAGNTWQKLRWLAGLSPLLGSLIGMFMKAPARFTIAWQPVAGEMALVFAPKPLCLLLILSATLCGFLLLQKWLRSGLTNQQTGWLFLSLAFSSATLLTDHFLLRFTALEGVGLCVVAAALIHRPLDEGNWRNVKIIFLNFRLGDLGLIAAIFIMFAGSATFQIDVNLANAAASSMPGRLLLVAGLLLAVWIKMGLWPLDWWLESIERLPSPARHWYGTLLLPTLGAYLLYRGAIVLSSLPVFSTLLVCLAMFAPLIAQRRKKFRINQENSMVSLQFSSATLIVLATTGAGQLLWAFLVAWLILRLVISLVLIAREHSPPEAVTSLSSSDVLAGAGPFILSFLILQSAIFLSNYSLWLECFIWLVWWLQVLHLAVSIFHPQKRSKNRIQLKKQAPFFRSPSAIAFMTVMILPISSLALSVYLSQGASLLNPPWWSVSFLTALIIAVLVRSIILLQQRNLNIFNQKMTDLFKQIPILRQTEATGGQKDPLDFSFAISKLVVSVSNSIYQNVERSGFRKIISAFYRTISFLYTKVERFASADLWKAALGSVMDFSRQLQRLHPGLLRLNLLWILVFMMVLALFVFQRNGMMSDWFR